MDGYTKLFQHILTSTVWAEPDPHRIVWITLLALMNREGKVRSSVPGLAHMARVSRENCESAVAAFLAPDIDSRTKEFEGRRIAELPEGGGWVILNAEKYRAAMSADETRVRKAKWWREHRGKDAPRRALDESSRNSNDSTQASTEATTTKPTPPFPPLQGGEQSETRKPKPNGQWWRSEAQIIAKGAELGMQARPGESIGDFKGRIDIRMSKD